MPASATVSVRRQAETQPVIEPSADSQGVPGADPEELSAWHPVSEQSILAALALLTGAT